MLPPYRPPAVRRSKHLMRLFLISLILVFLAGFGLVRTARAASDEAVNTVLQQLGRGVEARILSLATTDLPETDLELDTVIGVAKRINANMIFIEVLADDGYVIYPSRVWPHREQGQDRLQRLIERAHTAGIHVVPWIKTFFATATGELGPVLGEHPEWAAVGSDGSTFTSYNMAWFNPAHPDARAFILEAILELVTAYEIDGLQLDYIRYPNSDFPTLYSYDEYSRSRFLAETGIDPITLRTPSFQQLTGADARLEAFDPAWQQWTVWRENQVTQFVAELARRVRRIRPDLPLFFGVIPALWTGTTYPYARFYQNQHWAEWVEAGFVDALTPPVYTDQESVLRREVGNIARIAIEHSADGPVLIYPSLMVYPDPPVLVEEIEVLRSMGVPGVRLFSYGRMRLPHLRALWEGPFVEPALIPHAKPFLSAWHLVREIDDVLRDLVTLQAIPESLADGIKGDIQALDRGLAKLASLYPTSDVGSDLKRTVGLSRHRAAALRRTVNRVVKAVESRLETAGDDRLREAIMANLEFAKSLVEYGIRIELR